MAKKKRGRPRKVNRERVRRWLAAHPCWSNARVARRYKIHPTMVGKVLKEEGRHAE
jgi:transposase